MNQTATSSKYRLLMTRKVQEPNQGALIGGRSKAIWLMSMICVFTSRRLSHRLVSVKKIIKKKGNFCFLVQQLHYLPCFEFKSCLQFLLAISACNFCLQFLLAISACNFCLQFLLAISACKFYLQILLVFKILKKIRNF